MANGFAMKYMSVLSPSDYVQSNTVKGTI